MNTARRIFIYTALVVAFLLAMSVFTPTWAQQNQPMGATTNNVYAKGMLSADSALRAAKQFKVYPYFDSTGELAVVGHNFYYHNGLIWVKVPDTASLNGIYFKKIDSNTHKNPITLDYFNAHNVNFIGTPGSVVFLDGAGALSENNSNFFWDNSITRLKTTSLSVGTSSASYTLDMGGEIGWDAGLGSISHIVGPTDQSLKISSGGILKDIQFQVAGNTVFDIDQNGELNWPPGLGPIQHIIGPLDQDLAISSLNTNSIQFLIGSTGPAVAINGATGGLKWFPGLSPISHILGPTDQDLGISSASGRDIDFQINGTKRIAVSSSGNLVMYGSSSGSLTIKVPSVVTTYSVTMPASQGAANTIMVNDGTGGLTWNTASAIFTPTITLTGDATGTGVGTIPVTLASVGTAGTAGSATQVGVTTYDSKGRETGWANTTITPAIPSILGGTAGSVIFSNGTNLTENNSHLFWSDANKRFGVNNNTPMSSLEVTDTSTNTIRGIINSQYNTGTNSAQFNLFKARGTISSPATIVTGDLLGRIIAGGYDGAAFLSMADIKFMSTGTIGTNRVPTIMTFSTGTDAAPSVLTERMRIDQAGNVGIGTTSLTSFLTLAGQIGWSPTLGAISHILGPTDQPLQILAGVLTASLTGQDINLYTQNGGAGTGHSGHINIITGQTGSFSTAGGNITITANTGTSSTAPGGEVLITSNGKNSGIGTAITCNTGLLNITQAGSALTTTANVVISTTNMVTSGVSASGVIITAGNGAGGTNPTTGGGGTGGLQTVTTGTGGGASGSNTGVNGGNGGAYTLSPGAGGAQASNGVAASGATLTGGNGATVAFGGGAGGNANGSASGVSHIGGNGTTYTWNSGNGGTSTGASGTNNGGNGGNMTMQTGQGGAGTTASGTSGTISFNIGGANTKLLINAAGDVIVNGSNALLVNTATNNGVDKLIVNGSVNSVTPSTGASTDGMVMYNISSGQYRYYLASPTFTGTGSTTFTLPANTVLDGLAIRCASAQNISAGTTLAGTDIMNSVAFSTAFDYQVLNRWFSTSSSQTIFITGGATSCTITAKMK